jgi:hypothetical protein
VQQGISFHAMHGAANSQSNWDRIWMVCNGTNEMTHGLTGELVPLDAWRIMQDPGKPGKKEAKVGSPFCRITKGAPIVLCALQFLLELFGI